MLGHEMQGSILLTNSPDRVALSAREIEQLTRGNKVSFLLHRYENEYRWQHKACLDNCLQRWFECHTQTVCKEVTATCLCIWEIAVLKCSFTGEGYLSSNYARMAGMSFPAPLQLATRESRAKTKALDASLQSSYADK